MSQQDVRETFDNSIKQGILRVDDSVWLGTLFPYIVSIKDIDGDNILYVSRENFPDHFSFEKNIGFPYGIIRKKDGKYEIETNFGDYIRRDGDEKFFCDAFTNKKYGIECVRSKDSFFRLRFSKEILVIYSDENDFPVLWLPQHDAYRVE